MFEFGSFHEIRMLHFVIGSYWGIQSHQVSDFMVLDVHLEEDLWFGLMGSSIKSLMKVLAQWRSTLGVQVCTPSLQAKQSV